MHADLTEVRLPAVMEEQPSGLVQNANYESHKPSFVRWRSGEDDVLLKGVLR
jgi:hypothetical protein